jgi:malate dehydrogenase (oxaloacetate-decarboxylating)
VLDYLSFVAEGRIVDVSDQVFSSHLGGKIAIHPKIDLNDRATLSHVYTPGVAQVCEAICDKEDRVYSYTMKKNTVAVVTDGTAVLGLGNIGPKAALPVMEGKAILFKALADIDSFPICLDTVETEEIVHIIKAISPGIGGINLEDIAAPRCFIIEEKLKQELKIPVFHDDQHGTAVVVLAGLLNALKIVGKSLTELKVVISGVGAAGVACGQMLRESGVENIIGVGRKGAIYRGGDFGRINELWFAKHTNPENLKGTISDVIDGADLFIGVSAPNLLSIDDVKKMNRDPIVFALANPIPEIDPVAAAPHVRIMATGRSDFPNQINNVLAFPGIFRGALDCRATEINQAMKLAAARAIAEVISEQELNENYIIPDVFNPDVVKKVRDAVIKAAHDTNVSRLDKGWETSLQRSW